MGRPEPSVLFAQAFAHAHLDEYVDEVIFSEPVVVTACEFLEQSLSSSSPAVTLLGRLCQPFLYSPSSSNVLEVEAIVTNHLVVRGSYRCLSLVIYGNTGEDLGQFNIGVDLDGSLTNTVSVVGGNLEDLPPALHPRNSATEQPISLLKSLNFKPAPADILVEIQQFLQISFKVLEMPTAGYDALNAVVNSLVSAATVYSTQSLQRASRNHELADREESCFDFSQATKQLLNLLPESLTDSVFLESEGDVVNVKLLVDLLTQHYHDLSNCGSVVGTQLPQSKLIMVWLSAALLLCSHKESCFNFVNGGGMKQLGDIFCTKVHSRAATLILLGVIEQATRHSIGCEGFLNWWPREDDKIPIGTSESYNQLLKLLTQKPRHDVASLATYILHRVRSYEVASRYELAILRALGGFSAGGNVMPVTTDMLASVKLQLQKLLKLITSNPLVEDPSPVASTSRSLLLGETDGLLSYKATSKLIALSNCRFSNWDIDSHLLFLLKERGFLPLSAALLSSSTLRSEVGPSRDLFMDITSCITSIILSLVCCRSGLMFLLIDPELATTVIHALQGSDSSMQESIPLRYASVLISKGFFCHSREIGTIIKTHLRVMNVLDRLISSQQHLDELLSNLWELRCISRSDCGRQALLAIGNFPEAVSVLIAALHSVKELESVSVNAGSSSGTSPLNLAIFHSAVEIFEVIVSDSTSSSLSSWIGHAKELHKALHSSSPGSTRKDASTRLLELIDGGVVYHKNGAIGLLRYAAVLASGGDAHMASTNILACDDMDVDNVVGDASGNSDGNIIDNLLGKPITESRFLGYTLGDSSVAQLTTTFRILAFISDNPVVAGALYDEGAVMVVHAVLIDCKLILEKSSNNYDYLVDEGTECNTTSDILLERNREQSVVDLLVPCLSLLINMLHKLEETKEQHRNKKLMKALLNLHRELSPKLAACAVNLSYPYPNIALGFQVVCHLIVSALACWPVYGWTPTLFHFLIDSLHATSLLAMGPKETCSLLFLLNDLLPDEGVSLWENGIPMLSVFRQLAVGSLLGPAKEKEINWYLQAGHKEKLIGQLTPMLNKILEIVLHCAISALVVIQDLLRIFIIRVACIHADSAAILLRPVIQWIDGWLSGSSTLTDTDAYKVYRALDFIASLLEHPHAKSILLKEGIIQLLSKTLKSSTKLPQISWRIPAFKEYANSLLQTPSDTVTDDEGIARIFRSMSSEGQRPSKMRKISNSSIDQADFFGLNSYGDKFMWECPENMRDSFSQSGQSLKRKLTPLEAATRRPRDDNGENTSQSTFSRGPGQFTAPPGPTRRDTFRLRKPNTSRPPSMHVDDYVARERNDGTTSSNVIAIPRIGSSGGRPPSIHVDEFMARERERKNPMSLAGSLHMKNTPENDPDAGKTNKSKNLRPDLDDDLQGVDIVFGGDDSGSDDRLPFPQPDDSLNQPPTVIDDQNSPRSIVEETESGSGLGTPLTSGFDDHNNQSELSSRVSVSRPEMSLTREPSISSEKKFFDHAYKPDRFSSSGNNKNPMSSPQALYPNTSHGPAGAYDQKFPMTQPPLPPMPPPPTLAPVNSRTHDSSQPPLPPGFHAHSDYSRTSRPSSGGSVRPQPPLPPTPPPYTAAASLSSLRTSAPQSCLYNQSNIGSSDLMQSSASSNMASLSYPPLPLMPPMIFNRPGIPYNLYGNPPTPNQGENQSTLPQNFPASLSSLPPMTQLQPLQPPQLPRPPHPPPQHLRPPTPASTQPDQAMAPQMQQMVQPATLYYQTMHQESFSQNQLHQQGQSSNFQQQDASAQSLQHIFSSPEAIKELLRDREKLVQLLEQYPKLMQMLQDQL